MPAIITHHLFAREAYAAHRDAIGEHPACERAFCLGSQGPDPYFYLTLRPGTPADIKRLGSILHQDRTADLIAALRAGAEGVEGMEGRILRAWLRGFLAHYALDSTAHPFIYATEFALCDAGVPGLTRSSGSEVHGEIEHDLDEAVLFSKLGCTIVDYRPDREALACEDETLASVGRLMAWAIRQVYGIYTSNELYARAVRMFRLTARVLWDPAGARVGLIAALEHATGETYSVAQSHAHRVRASAHSAFDNAARAPWRNPWTGTVSTASFADLYNRAQEALPGLWSAVCAPGFDRSVAAALAPLDFDGKIAAR